MGGPFLEGRIQRNHVKLLIDGLNLFLFPCQIVVLQPPPPQPGSFLFLFLPNFRQRFNNARR
jgi:hypothetical protein